MNGLEEENPALGWRAVRIGLDRPALLRVQLRAMLHAAAGRELRVMLPMVSDVAEYRRGQADTRSRDRLPPSNAAASCRVR